MMLLRKKWLKDKLTEKRRIRKLNSPVRESQAIVVSDFLDSNRIRFFENHSTHELILEELVKALSFEDPASISAAIWKREEIGSTAITSDVAFPHARLLGLNQITAALGICPAGIKTGESSIRLFFLFVSPIENTRNHLRFMASVSSLFLQEGFINALMELKTSEAVFEKIREIEMKSREQILR